ncbi:WD40/YVTN/BNR-like repeat-containing protein [Micromonospora echinofusca]|uniref:BNR repeat-like domain-containing protein n=1 Tax=Micromonospora echinofusca TaxID=47858 RepID=A0ABS3VSE6_MICEH|nr:hypothetical protein [Micromonospora echinofusca]MBO4207288.1 hypothetical protein [Micromonospora echinofusca]
MPELDFRGPDFRGPDFRGLDSAAQAAFRPHFADVLHRARRRRRTRIVAAVVTGAAVLAGGGVAVAQLPARHALPPADSPTPTPEFLPAPDPAASARAQAPGRRTRYGPTQAGDLDRLYVRYGDCRDRDCAPGVAVSADRGRTWQKIPLPVPVNSLAALYPTGPRTVAVRVQTQLAAPGGTITGEKFWLTSLDGGLTWRRAELRQVPALPAGARVPDRMPGPDRDPLITVDPSTGDVLQLAHRSTLRSARFVESIPVDAGLWVSGSTGASTGPDSRISYTGSAVEVSRDGGRSWQRYVFPEQIVSNDDFGGVAVASHNGQTAYAVGRVGATLRIYRTVDGGRSWQRTAATAQVGERRITAAVRSDGTLVVQAGLDAGENPVMFTSTDRGNSLQPVPLGPGASAVPVPGGYAQSGWPQSSAVWLSVDGDDWSHVAPPD